MYKRILFSILCILVFVGADGQEKITREQYVKTYADLAMKEMIRAGIPASITLAQGCLESDNGNSRLARNAKNHFGIKCHDWTGGRIHHDDDERNECFRKYKSVNESFIDHSDFLTTKSRYAGLFELKPDDYKGWARGLKKAGYATSNQYADLLIRIIEENQLYNYDMIVLNMQPFPGSSDLEPGLHREIFTNNRIEYILVKEGDTPSSLRQEMNLYPGEIYRYNDISRGETLDSGMIIYLQPKRWKAERGYEFHEANGDETLHEISQLYGVKLKRLSRMNNLGEDSLPVKGTVIWLRKSKPSEGEEPNEKKEMNVGEEDSEMEFRIIEQ